MSTPYCARVLCRPALQGRAIAGGWIESIPEAHRYLAELRACDRYTPYWVEYDNTGTLNIDVIHAWEMRPAATWPRPYPKAVNSAAPPRPPAPPDEEDFERRVQEEVRRRLASQQPQDTASVESSVDQLVDASRQQALEVMLRLMQAGHLPEATAVPTLLAGAARAATPPPQQIAPATRRPKPTTRPTPKPRADPPPSPAPSSPRPRQILED